MMVSKQKDTNITLNNGFNELVVTFSESKECEVLAEKGDELTTSREKIELINQKKRDKLWQQKQKERNRQNEKIQKVKEENENKQKKEIEALYD